MNRCSDTLPPQTSGNALPATSGATTPARTLWVGLLAALAAVATPAALTATLALTAPMAWAQGVGRPIPADVKFGKLMITQPPDVMMDGSPDRMSPGARIRHTNNLLVMSGPLVGLTLPVIYRRDTYGLIHEVWLLTPEEAARLDNSTGAAFTQALNTLLGIIFGGRH